MLEILKICISMLMEGLSIPFPGIIFLLSYGNVQSLSASEAAVLSVFLAASYTLGSFAPYAVGKRLGRNTLKIFGKKANRAIRKASLLINKYGLIIISVSRPFSWGNYISYIAGISKVKKIRYGILTFVGIYPWCFAVLLLGRIFRGNISYVMEYINSYTVPIYAGFGLIASVYVIFKVLKYKK